MTKDKGLMTRREMLPHLEEWLTRFQQIENAYAALHETFDAAPECPMALALYQPFDSYTARLGDLIGDPGGEWLHWFLWENKAGKTGHVAKSAHMPRLRRIRTLEDLAHLISPE